MAQLSYFNNITGRTGAAAQARNREGLNQELTPPQIPDHDRRIEAALAGERGSTWNQERLFEWYDAGLIFLQGPVEDFEIEAMLRADGKARAVEQVLTLPVRGARWEVTKPPGDTGQRDYVMDLLTRPTDQGGMQTTIQSVIAQATSACLYRSSCFEKVFKLADNGNVVYDKVAWRPPTTCYLARSAQTAELAGFLQWTWTDIARFERIYIPSAKSWVYLHGTNRDPIMGASDIEVCYRAFQTKQKLRFLWASYMENQVIPKALAQAGSGDEGAAGMLAKKVATLKGGGVIGLTNGQSVSAFEPGGNGGQTFQAAISYLDEEMYASILANFLSLATASGVRGGGSFALSLSQTDFYMQSRQAVMAELAESLTHQVIAPMVRWNFGATVPVPRFKFVSMAPTENTTEALMQMVTALVAVPAPAGGVAPVPQEFVDELVSAVASMLAMDADKIHDAIAVRTKVLDATGHVTPSAAPLHAAADVGAALVAGKGATTNGHAPAAAGN